MPSLLSSSESEIFKCTDQLNNTSKKMQTFYERNEFCDVVLIAGRDSARVQAHRIVLSASSDYFHAMFRCNLQEASFDEIELKEFDGDTMKLFIDFMYTASIELRCETIESVLIAANFLQIRSLISSCYHFIEKRLDVKNCLGIASFADRHSFTELHKKASAYAYIHFNEVRTGEEFMQLNEEQLNKFLSSDHLDMHSEEDVFHSLVAWVEYDKENREQLMYNLLSVVHFKLLTPKFIIENRHSLCKSTEYYELICSWLQWHLSPESRSQFPAERTVGRIGKQVVGAISDYFWTDDFKMQVYNQELNTWSYRKLPNPARNRTAYSATIIDDKLVIAGGSLNCKPTNSVECLDLQTMVWSDLPPMGLARQYCEMVELNGDLYVLGGLTVERWLCSVEKFNFFTCEWQDVAPLLSPHEFIQTAVLDGFLYAIGGDYENMECYDVVADKWTKKSSRNDYLKCCGLAALKGHLYAVGGDCNGEVSKVVECYHPSTDSWTFTSSLNYARSELKCITLNNRLIACGGYGSGKQATLVQEYNPETDEWNILAPMLEDVLPSFIFKM